MKLMVASDIHGSAYYCKKLMVAFNKENPDKLLLLGDLLYHGPRNDLPGEYAPKDVAKMLNDIKTSLICVRGNCDSEVDQMMVDFPILAEYSQIFLDNKVIFATHGHHFCDTNLPPLNQGDILLCGHTHIPTIKCIEGVTYINPGSVSIPKENSHHGYMIFENNMAIWKNLDGEIIKTENL